MYFGFDIWHAAVAYYDGVAIEQLNKFMTWREMLSYKIQEIISNFSFDINNKWTVKPNDISFSISFAVADIFVCGMILQIMPIADSRIFLELSRIFLLIR